MNSVSVDTAGYPPSVDHLARELGHRHLLPHPILVDCARRAIAENIDPDHLAAEFASGLLRDVVNATGVLLHTHLGRAQMAIHTSGRASNLEIDLVSGQRGQRQAALGKSLAILCGAEAAIVVNNNAAAVLSVLSALASNRDFALSRGESVEIGGSFRIPEIAEQSGARLIDVGTTNRTRLRDYKRAVEKNDIALVMKVHPSNYQIAGFVEGTSVRELSTLSVPVVVDIGSGLVDGSFNWLDARPKWLASEPAARQTISEGADLVTFSGDKLFGGPQCGVIVGRADLVATCLEHPLMRALRPSATIISAMQSVVISYLNRTAGREVSFWKMAMTKVEDLIVRAEGILGSTGIGVLVELESIPGAGTAPGVVIPSAGIALDGDRLRELRSHRVPILARVKDGKTYLDLRTVDPQDDQILVDALLSLTLA